MSGKRRAYIQLHTAVLLFGFTAILGKLISLNGASLVWHRLWISVLGLLFIPGAIRGIKAMKSSEVWRFSGIGVLVIVHWVTFYGSIKLGNSASVTLACLSTTTLFTSFLEPAIMRTAFNKIEIFLGLLVIVGIWLVTRVGEAYYTAIITGLFSAFVAALFSTLNKKYIGSHHSISVTMVELGAGWVALTVIWFLSGYLNPADLHPESSDWVYLILLSLICTSLAFALSLEALKVLSAFVSNLAISLEPVYGILLAIWILHEGNQLNPSFYAGTMILLLAVLAHPFLVKWQDRRAQSVRLN